MHNSLHHCRETNQSIIKTNTVMAARCLCSSLLSFSSGCHHLSSVSVSGHHISDKNSRGILSSSSTRGALPIRFRECREAVCVDKAQAYGHGSWNDLSRSRVRAAAADDDGAAADSAARTKGRQLWRSELESSASELSNDEFEPLERDIERFAKKEEREKLWSDRSKNGQAAADEQQQRGCGIRDVVDKILVADFFFILFILVWLLAGLAEQGALESSRLIDSWLPLWPSVFQPALGVFMAGAIVSAITKKE